MQLYEEWTEWHYVMRSRNVWAWACDEQRYLLDLLDNFNWIIWIKIPNFPIKSINKRINYFQIRIFQMMQSQGRRARVGVVWDDETVSFPENIDVVWPEQANASQLEWSFRRWNTFTGEAQVLKKKPGLRQSWVWLPPRLQSSVSQCQRRVKWTKHTFQNELLLLYSRSSTEWTSTNV